MKTVKYLHPTKGWKKGSPAGFACAIELEDGTLKRTPELTKSKTDRAHLRGKRKFIRTASSTQMVS